MLDLAYKIIGKEFMIDYLDKYAEMGNFEKGRDDPYGGPSSFAPGKGYLEKRFSFIARNEDYVRPERGEYNFPNEWADGFIHFTLAKNEGGNDSRYKWDVRLQEAWKNLGYGEEVQPIPNEYKVALAYFISTNVRGPMPWEAGCNADACWVSPQEALNYILNYYMISGSRAVPYEYLAFILESDVFWASADISWSLDEYVIHFFITHEAYNRGRIIAETKKTFIGESKWAKDGRFKSGSYITNMELCEMVAECGQFRVEPARRVDLAHSL